MRKLWALLSVPAILLWSVSAYAQEAAPAPAHLAVVDGSATLNRDGQPDQAIANMPFIEGDRLRTTSGRVEILFPDGVALDVDGYTEVGLEAPNVIRLTEGRALLRVPNARYTATEYDLETPAASVGAVRPGEYRLAYPEPFESARVDEFEGWIREQSAEMPAVSASAQYLPPDLQMYGAAFDEYGGWQYDQAYGYVWYPTVGPAWRPYYDGYWSPIPSYGWTWIGIGLWSWPTHHYGRWGWHHNRWFWIPARSWAPAWVAWGASSDYVTWCPLGWDSQPVFALSVGHVDPWVGWTVMPRGVFGYSRVYVGRHVVPPHRIHMTPTSFVAQPRAPMAVPRAVANHGWPGSRPGRVTAPRAGASASPSRVPDGRSPVEVPRIGSAGPRAGAAPAYRSAPSPGAAGASIDRRPQRTPATAGVAAERAYRAPSLERRPLPVAPGGEPRSTVPPRVERVEPVGSSRAPQAVPRTSAPARVEPIAPPRTPQAAPRSNSAPRQEPIGRPQPQATPSPNERGPHPQAQPRSEQAGARQQQAQPRGGERKPR